MTSIARVLKSVFRMFHGIPLPGKSILPLFLGERDASNINMGEYRVSVREVEFEIQIRFVLARSRECNPQLIYISPPGDRSSVR